MGVVLRARARSPRVLNASSRPGSLDCVPTWGLERAPVRQVADGVVCLDFTWDAVPPLVDLRRVVVPAARRGGLTPGQYVRKR